MKQTLNETLDELRYNMIYLQASRGLKRAKKANILLDYAKAIGTDEDKEDAIAYAREIIRRAEELEKGEREKKKQGVNNVDEARDELTKRIIW